MTEGKELAVRALDLNTLTGMGKVFYESGMFTDMKSASQCVVKIQAGSELGFPPIYAMTKIYIVKGRVMVGAEALGAMVKRSGQYDYRVVKLTDTECELMFTDKGKDAYLSHFTLEDAKRADLVQPGGGWNKWPRAMLMSKALSQGARIVCPHIISGAYTAADFGYAEDDEGNIQEPVSETSKPPTPEIATAIAPGLARGEVKAEPSPEIPAPQQTPPTTDFGIDVELLKKHATKCRMTLTDMLRYCATTFKKQMTSTKNLEGLLTQLTLDQRLALFDYMASRAEVS